MKAHLVALLVLPGVLAGALNAAPTQRALLIGINTYQPRARWPSIPPIALMAAAGW